MPDRIPVSPGMEMKTMITIEPKILKKGPIHEEFQKMLKERVFNMVPVNKKSGMGVGKDVKPATSLTYKGEGIGLKIE